MNAQQILQELEPLGSESYKRTLLRHGAKEPCLGVKISELKKIQKRVKKDYRLALDLYETRVYEARYLAGLIADDAKMTRTDLQRWVQAADAPLAGSTVPSVAAGSPHGWDLALEWIESPKPLIAAAGWSTLACIATVKPDAELDIATLKKLLQRVQKEIHKAPNAVRSPMNQFLIAVGCAVAPLTKLALEIGERIGTVEVDVGDTDCAIPFAPDYIRKVEARGSIGSKRKSAKC